MIQRMSQEPWGSGNGNIQIKYFPWDSPTFTKIPLKHKFPISGALWGLSVGGDEIGNGEDDGIVAGCQ